ncbi:hypothetical protein HOLleu_33362 [Holothuria leucospilota]|uniref:Uncharacterized protein n=1 Tax=Holothuria leucospilota TaxID=206669 RepID=A0A9Q1BH67_HOLLE|nr:hypothetical protein HOLleu_33362 [Holothuria leucospilota]
MDFPDIWSTEVEIMSAASILQTDIYTFALHGNLWKWLRYPAAGNFDEPVDMYKRAIYLVNTSSVHYDVVLDIGESTSTVENSYPLPTCKTTEQLVKEEIHRQSLWQKQKLEQKTGDTSRTITSSSTMRMRKLRAQNSDYREMEKLKARQHQRQKRRSNHEFKMKERQANLKYMKTSRSNDMYKKKEGQANLNRIKTKRSNEEYKKKESQANLSRIKAKRLNEDYKTKESQANLKRVQSKRSNEEYKKEESQANLNRMKTIRSTEEYKKKKVGPTSAV